MVNFLVNGIYGLARNPTYLGLLLSSHGWALAFRSGVGVILTTALLVPLGRASAPKSGCSGSNLAQSTRHIVR